MKRTSEREKDIPDLKVGDRVHLDTQPFVWEVKELDVDRFKNRVKIYRPGKDEIVNEWYRTVDAYRLSVIPANLPQQFI